MAILCAIFLVASIRTNIIFFLIFLLLVPCCKTIGNPLQRRQKLTCLSTVSCLSASFFAVAHGASDSALTFQHAGAGLLLGVSLLGWYIFFALVLLSVDFPLCLPLGDLSTVIRGRGDQPKQDVDEV